jgi:Na+/H+ antiporter NhaD/arsenite permease-like protein
LTNPIALVLGLVLIAAIGADLLANDGAALMFAMRKFLDLLDWVVFWR